MGKTKERGVSTYYDYGYTTPSFKKVVIKPSVIKEDVLHIIKVINYNDSRLKFKVMLSKNILDKPPIRTRVVSDSLVNDIKNLYSLVSLVNKIRLKKHKIKAVKASNQDEVWSDMYVTFILSDKNAPNSLEVSKLHITDKEKVTGIDYDTKVSVIRLDFAKGLNDEYTGFSFSRYDTTIKSIQQLNKTIVGANSRGIVKLFNRLNEVEPLLDLISTYPNSEKNG